MNLLLKSGEITLRPFIVDDTDDFVESANDASGVYAKLPKLSKLKARGYLQGLVKRENVSDSKRRSYTFAIVKNNKCIGSIGLYDVVMGHKAEIGSIWIRKSEQGKGIGTKVTKLVTDFGFKNLNLVRIYAYVEKINKASITMFNNVKYKPEGYLRKVLKMRGKFVDHFIYAKIK